ncbi:ribosome small subunit-dependent GTPase A [Croceibacterium soli]|uniref:ribosome small subunit-dependent GTPase A n=1 Tax=Croceibacterium soli TaxID=1739690 RepID=UPI0019251D9E|nr:ribosome small subunit-dependent GTPase A [Croceibacterium soli]
MTRAASDLAELGWRPFFSEQVPPEDAGLCPVRVMAAHRGKIAIAGAGLDCLISPYMKDAETTDDRPAVGDWLLVDRTTMEIVRILRRATVFKRPAPGSDRKVQLIAANVDTVFIVASCNQDFSVARLERYLVLAREAAVTPVVVLTKADLANDPEGFAAAARDLQPGLTVETLNARDPASARRLARWCGKGETVALLGSSGVGKSTLINSLRGSQSILTQPVREADAKGRHTTTVREMHRLADGGWLMDTPGMRELQLSEAAAGVAEVFDDIVVTARQCRFSDCTHAVEPGCAVQADLASGKLDRARYDRWRKLSEENAANDPARAKWQRGPKKPASR